MELKIVEKPLLIELFKNAATFLMKSGVDTDRFLFEYDDRDLTQVNFLFRDEHFRRKEVAWITLNDGYLTVSELYETKQWGLEKRVDKNDQVGNKRREIVLQNREYCKDLSNRLKEYLTKVLGPPSFQDTAWAKTEYKVS